MTSLSIEKGTHLHNLSLTERLRQKTKLAKQSLEFVMKNPVQSVPVETPESDRPNFTLLDELREELHQTDDREEIRGLLTETAEHLLDKQKRYEEIDRRHSNIGLPAVWSALRAWDDARTEPTEALAIHLLNEFWGSGQPALIAAFNRTRKYQKEERPISFIQALDEVNREHEPTKD